MIVSLTKRPLAVLVALILALSFALGVFASAAQAQPTKHAFCHGTGSSTNSYVIVVVDAGHPAEARHEKHLNPSFSPGTIPDIDLGLTDMSTSEFKATHPVEEFCVAGTTGTTTTGTTTTGTTTGFVKKPPKVIVKKKPHVIVKKKPVIIKKKASVSATPTASVKTVTASASGTTTGTTTGTATATPTASAASAQYTQSATVTALPSTGGTGPVLPIAVGALLLVLGSGIMVLKMARSSS